MEGRRLSRCQEVEKCPNLVRLVRHVVDSKVYALKAGAAVEMFF